MRQSNYYTERSKRLKRQKRIDGAIFGTLGVGIILGIIALNLAILAAIVAVVVLVLKVLGVL